ncbi:MAG: hypothetical protein ACRC3B_12050 [Bacteroidia bacterium]
MIVTEDLGWSIDQNNKINGSLMLTNTGKDTLTINNLRSNDGIGTVAWLMVHPVAVLPPGYSVAAEYKSSVISSKYGGNTNLFLDEVKRDTAKKVNCFYIYADIKQKQGDEKFIFKYCFDQNNRVRLTNDSDFKFSKQDISVRSADRFGFVQINANDSTYILKGIITVTNKGNEHLSIKKVELNSLYTLRWNYEGAYDNIAYDSSLTIPPGGTVVIHYTVKVNLSGKTSAAGQIIQCTLYGHSRRNKHRFQVSLAHKYRTAIFVEK